MSLDCWGGSLAVERLAPIRVNSLFDTPLWLVLPSFPTLVSGNPEMFF